MLPYEPWLAERYVISAVLIVLICATADDSWAACRDRPPTVRLLVYPSNECRYRPSRSGPSSIGRAEQCSSLERRSGFFGDLFLLQSAASGWRNPFRCEYYR